MLSKCPVCHWEIKQDGRSVSAGGVKATVCCDDCAAKFKADPRRYAAAGESRRGRPGAASK